MPRCGITGGNSSDRLGGGEAAAGVLEDGVPLPPAGARTEMLATKMLSACNCLLSK